MICINYFIFHTKHLNIIHYCQLVQSAKAHFNTIVIKSLFFQAMGAMVVEVDTEVRKSTNKYLK
jgi:hypothetical protein